MDTFFKSVLADPIDTAVRRGGGRKATHRTEVETAGDVQAAITLAASAEETTTPALLSFAASGQTHTAYLQGNKAGFPLP